MTEETSRLIVKFAIGFVFGFLLGTALFKKKKHGTTDSN